MIKLFFLILFALALQACSKGTGHKSDRLEEAPNLREYLLDGNWRGTKISMPGLATFTEQQLGYEPLLSFKKGEAAYLKWARRPTSVNGNLRIII